MTIRTALRLALSAILGTAAIAAADTTYLPGAAELTGLAGARFSSTLELSNPGATGTTATIGLVPMAGKAAPAPVARTLAAGESLRIPEALKTLFGLAEGAAGTLTLTSDEPLLANLSTRNVAAPEGAYGLGLLPVPSSDLLGAGETGHSIWVSQSADPAKGYRTNLSVTLVDPGTIVEVRVLDAEGRVAGAATVTAETAQVWQQPAASLIGFATDLPVGRAEFEVKAGRATAYAVVNDNVTSDAIALQVERVVPGPTDRLISGAALAPGQLGSFWSTDLRLFNPGSTAVDATIQSVGASREGSAVVPVPAKGVVEVSRALALLGFPEGTACALRVRAGASLLVAARTNNVDPAGIRKGTFSAQQFVTSWPAGLLGAGALGFFNGVDQSFNVPGVRTNLTVVGGPEGAAGELVLRDAAGLEHGRRAFARGPGEWGQQSVAEWFAPATVPGNSRVDVAVASGALDAFVSRIDNGSGDAITRPVALLGGGDCTKVVIASLDAEPKPIAAGVPTTFSWTVVLDPPAAELTSQSIRFDGEPEIELGKEIRSYVRSFDAAAARSATLTVRKGSCVKTRSLTFFVCGPLSLEPTTLPDATAFVVYPPRTITVPGATPPTTFTVAAGVLPDGMSLSAAGELSGKPEEVGLFTFTVKAVDANGCVGTREYALRVFCPTLRIVPTTLPAGTVATPYTSIRFTVTGGSGTGTWSATGLPPGLALSTGGQLSGTPTAAGNYTVAVRFRDSSGCIGTASYTVLVCNTLVLTPGTLPAATAGTPYGPVPFNAAGATGAATWAVTTGSLPAGVTLNAGTGALSGTPTVVGTFPFTVTATDTLGCTGSVAVSLLVNCPVITVNPASLANGTAGVAYGPVSLSQTGGLGTVTYAVTAGALPAGTSLSAAGVLSGAPTVTGTFNFTVTATDVNGCTGTRAYTLTIACPVISLSPASLANGTAGVAFGPVALTQTGGVGAVSYAVTAGALPAGMTLGAAGVLGGTPTVVGPFGFTVTATDANGCTGTRAYSLTVDCPVINVNPVSVANGTAGVAYPGATFTQTGGVGTITWSLAAGTLPAGMSLAAGSGLLSGTPTVTGGFPITVRATDANGCFGERVLTLTIVCPTINVSPASLSNGTAGVVYPGATFTQTGGVGTIAWSLAAGTLPTGLSLNPVSGLLSGTPLQTGAFPITVRATDANGCTGDRALTLTILCPTIVASPGSPLGGIEGSVFGPIAFNQTGAVGAVAWTSTGTLPAGLTFSAAGVLTGTPAAGSAGSYTVTFTVTDQNLCQGSVQITFRICPVVTVGPNPLAAFLQSQLYAETLAGAGGVAPYTFAVTAGTLPAGVTLTGATGALSGTPTTLEAYDFTITATDTNGCTGSRQYTGRVCPVITVTTNLPNGVVGAAYSQTLAAAGSPDVPYAFSLTGGALPDGVTLVAGALTGNPTTPGSFTFTITATDTNGCAGSRTYIVEVCLAPTITPTPASVCALSTGNTASGPAGATTYAWVIANGTITSATNLQTVTYTAGASGNVALTLTVTSASSCSSSTSLNVPINANPATPTITGVPPGGVCADSTGNTASGPAGATTYAWSITGGTITSATNLQTVTYTAGPSGSVNLTLVVTNASGCSATNNATAAINANPATPTITGVPPGGVCADSTGNTASGPAGATTYAWSITGGTITSATNAQAVTYTAGASGSVNLTLVVTNGSGCSATSSATATINANPATPTITGVPPGGVCADSTGNTASGPAGATTYAWSITGGTITSATNAQAVTYTAGASGSVNLTLVVTNGSGCSATSSATATINANPATPTITGVPPGGVCADSTGNTASGPAGATTYAWSITGGTITSATNAQAVTYTAGASGSVNLTLVVTNGSGCSATSSAMAAINANPATPTITGVPPGGVCADSTGNTASGPAGATTYAWSITGGTITSATNAQALTYTAGASGSVNLTLVVTNASGCSATSNATATINANPATPTITGVPPGGVCADSTGNTASGPAGATTYAWSITGGTITSATNAQAVTYTAGASGSVNLTLVVTNGSGCSATSSATATINANPATPTITGVPPGGVCADSTGNTASGPAGATTYAWSITGGTITSATNAQAVTYTAGASGSVNLTLVVTNGSGCSATSSAMAAINANPATPTITGVPPGGVCADSTGNTASGPAGATTYAWSITGGTITSATNAQALTYTAGASGSVNLTLVVTNASGCSATSNATATINANPATPTITTATARVCTSTLGNTASGPAGATTYAWSITGGTITSATNAQTVTYTAGASGSVNLTLVVTNASGCSATNSLVLPIDPLPALLPAAATAFAGTFNVGFSQAFTASGGTGPFTYTLAPATPPAGLTFVGGVLSGTPTATGTFAFTVTATSAVGCSSTTQSYSLTVRPNVAAADSYSGLGNTQLYVTGYVGAPTTPAVQTATTAIGNDTPAGGVAVVAQTTACTGIGGSLTIDALGRFVYTTPVATIGVATCAYTATSDTGATGTPATATGTITITLANRVWYVKNDATGGGLGRSNDPFDTLPEAESASVASDIIFVHFGTTGTTPIPSGIILKDGQKLWGEGIGLTVAPFGTLVPAGSRPRISNGSGDAVSVPATAGNRQNVEIRGLDLTGSVNAVDVTASGTNVVGVTISDNTVSGAGVEGIDLNAGSTGAFAATVSTNAITATGNGIDARTSAATALSLDISNDTVVSALNGILISGAGGGTLTITGFANNTVDGNTGGTGISVNTARFDADAAAAGYQSVLGGATSVGTSGNPVGASGVIFTNVSGDLAFTDLDVFASNGSGLLMTGTGAVNAGAGTGTRVTVGAGVGVVEATNGQAVDITNATVDLQLSSIRSTNSLLTGVSLVSVADGSTPAVFSAGAGSVILNASGNDFNVDGGNATISYAGPITNTAGRSVSVINRSADTVTFTGAISDTGTGVFLNANGTSAITFSGGLVASTGANTAFTATGGGTVVVCDENPCGASGSNGGLVNTLTTTTGTALNVANTSIGANDLEFRSISAGTVASGPANGIVLNGTGSLGGLKVKGTGSAGTGGTIQRATGHGISLTSTEAVSLESVNVTNNLGSGIGGTLVRGLVLNGCSITGNGDNAAADESGVNITELTGTVAGGARPTRFVNTTISNNFEFEVQVTNLTSSVNLDDFRLENCTISSNGATGFHGNLVSFLNQSSAGGAMTLTVTGGSYTGSAPNTATGIMCDTSSTGGGDVVCNVTGAGFTNNNVAVSVSSALAGDLTFNVANNTATGNRSHGLNLFVAANATGIAGGRFDGNTVGTQGVAGSGSSLGYGIRVQNEGVSTANPVRVVMNNNVVQETSSFSLVNVNQGIAGQTSSTATNLTITNNTLRNSAARAIVVQQNNATDADSAGRTCVDISGNVMTNIPGNVGDGTYIRLRRLDANSAPGDLFNVRQTSAANLALVNGGIVVGAISTSGTMTYNGGACPQP